MCWKLLASERSSWIYTRFPFPNIISLYVLKITVFRKIDLSTFLSASLFLRWLTLQAVGFGMELTLQSFWIELQTSVSLSNLMMSSIKLNLLVCIFVAMPCALWCFFSINVCSDQIFDLGLYYIYLFILISKYCAWSCVFCNPGLSET